MNTHSQYILLFFVAVFLSYETVGQIDDAKNRQLVLEKNIIDSVFIFGKWTKEGGTETHLKYLGSARTTSDGRVFKIMNSVWHWGLSHRATSRILIFDSRNRYLRNYYLISTSSDLPGKLDNGKLIFTNTDEACDPKIKTEVDLRKGLPKEFIIKCTGEFGTPVFFRAE